MQAHSTERNLRYLVVEIFWAAIFTGSVSFNAAYLIRLGGSNLLISLLTSGAALVNALVALPFATFLERRPRRKPWMLGSLAAMRLGHLGLILVPWLPGMRAETAVLLLILLNIPSALFIAGFLPMLADIIPLRRRARIFAARNMTLGATTMVATFVLGAWLSRAPFPLNYQVLYGLGVAASMISTFYMARIAMPDSKVPPRGPSARPTPATIRDLVTQQRSFANIVVNTLLFNIPFWMAVPLQPIYFVRDLGASDGWLGLWLGLISGGTILGNMLWQRVVDRRGAGWTLMRAAALSAAYYFLIGLFPNLNLILLFGLLAGIVNPGVELSHFNLLLEVCPEDRRTTYIGVFVMIMNIGFFLAPLAVAPLMDALGAHTVVLLLGGMRLLGAALFTLNPVRVVVEQPSGAV